MLEALAVFGAKYLIGIILAIAAVFALALPRGGRGKYIAVAVIAFPLAYLIAKVAGLFYGHLPPFAAEGFEPLIPHAADNAFPSDHALFAATAASVVFSKNKPLGLLLFLLAALVGISRVYAGLHSPIDIVAGALIAVAAASLAFFLLRRLRGA